MKSNYTKRFFRKKGQLIFYFFLISIFLWSCDSDVTTVTKENFNEDLIGNIFNDNKTIQNIYSLGNQANTKELLKYLSNDTIDYKLASIFTLASLGDSSVVMSLTTLLNDPDKQIREEVAFTLGIIGSSSAENFLIEAYSSESNNKVKKNILEALGRCGTSKGLSFISSLNLSTQQKDVLIGQSWGLIRLAIRNLTSSNSTKKAVEIISNDNIDEEVKVIISNYFSNARNESFNNFFELLSKEYNKSDNVHIKINLATAFGNTPNSQSLNLLHAIITSDKVDDRIKVNAIKSCSRFNYAASKDIIFKELKNRNLNIAVVACDFFVTKGISNDADRYFMVAKQLNDWQTRTKMLKAALKYSNDKQKIASGIISGYDKAKSVYEKASLLYALAGDPTSFRFVNDQTFSNNDKIISTLGIRTLFEMRTNPDFDKYHKELSNLQGDDLYKEFSLIFKKAIQSKDPALIYYGSLAMHTPKFGLREIYSTENTGFINNALSNCILPKDIKTYLELIKAIKYINGSDLKQNGIMKYQLVDWAWISTIPHKQKVKIRTTKGDIILELHVNKAPVAVANFIKLINENYYSDTYFYRVSPNVAVQSGCKRGDGWGHGNFAMKTETSHDYFTEGSVGMQNLGYEAESVQWFIAQAPLAKFDNKFTNFADVVIGMDVVHQLEVGDKINSIALKN